MSAITAIAIPECGDAYIMTDLAEPIARLIISPGTEISLGVDDLDDEAETFPIRIAFGEFGQLSVSLLPNDVVVLVERLQQVLKYGL